MSNKISRRAFLKCVGFSVAAVGSAAMLSGCKSKGGSTVVDNIKVGDTVKNWNGLGVQLTSVFHLTQDPAQEGYEYLGVRVTAANRTKNQTFVIGAQGIDAINAAYPVPPLSNVTPTSRPWPLPPRILLPAATARVLPSVPRCPCTTPTPRASLTARACLPRAPATSC